MRKYLPCRESRASFASSLGTRHRSKTLGTLGVIVVISVVLTACGGGSGAIAQILRPGIQNADVVFVGYADDIAKLARQADVTVPPSLDDAIQQTKAAVATGTRLTEEEAALLARGELWVKVFNLLDQFLQFAIGWETAIPDDAVRLVNASLRSDVSVAFRNQLDALEERVLKGLMCTAARDGLDEAGSIQADATTPDYEYVGVDSVDVEQFLTGELSQSWSGLGEAVDLPYLASETIDLSNEYIDGIVDIAESPSGAIAAANVVYFRSCVLK